MVRSPPLTDWVGQLLPDLTLIDSDAAPFALRGVGRPLVLFFYIRNGTPG